MKEKFLEALAFHQEGYLNKAKAVYREILASEPRHANSLHFLGVAAYQEKNFHESLELINKAIAINPNSASFYSNLGVTLMELKQFDSAADSYERAIELNPDNADFYYNHGNALRELENFELVIESYKKAIALNPEKSHYHHNLGAILLRLRDYEASIESFNKANQLNPDPETYADCGSALLGLNQREAAIASYQKAIELSPDSAKYYLNIGSALSESKQFESAILYYDKAIQLNPKDVDAYINKGNVLNELGQFDISINNYQKALAINPDYEYLLGRVVYAKNAICDWSAYEENVEKLVQKLQKKEKTLLPFPTLSIVDRPDLQLNAVNSFVTFNDSKIRTMNEIVKRPRKQKICIGYYSADFHNHATSYLMARLFELHDKSKFEIIAFSFGPENGDAMQNRVSAAFDKFMHVGAKSDREVARISRQMGVDIAIDLKGFTQDMRAGIFAERCAPIQVNYLGYPGTMGADYIDYIIADKTLIPEESQQYYSEKVAYLPGSYQVNDASRKISSTLYTKEALGLPTEGFVFCCFNNNYKITPPVFDSWMEILKAVEGSVLWLFESNDISMKNLKKEAEKRGVESSRLVFAKRMELSEHLARHKAADLFLDTLPYNAHTTCSDALWAGLPVLTLMGKSFGSRVAASLLNAIEMPELIVESRTEYEEKAIYFANNPEKLKEVKAKLERNRLSTSLFNTELFARNLEKVYSDMYDDYHVECDEAQGKNKRFNICIIHPKGYLHSEVFRELSELLIYSIRELGYEADISFNDIKPHKVNIIIGVHLLSGDEKNKIPANSIILNTEPMGNVQSKWKKNIIQYAESGFEMWDYNSLNVEYFKELGIDNVKMLHFGYQRELEHINLKKIKDCDIDVLFYGSISERRQLIIDNLRKRGVKVETLFGVYGEERNAYISRSKLILNHNVHEDFKIFDAIRVFYLLTNGVSVVAEVNENTMIEKRFKDGILPTSYDTMVESVVTILADEEGLQKQREAAYESIKKYPQVHFIRELIE